MMNVLNALPAGRRLLVALLVTAAGVTGSLSVTTSTATAATGTVSAVSPAMGSSRYEQRVQYWINVRRSQHGLRALRFAACADVAAERWGRYLASSDSFFHQSMNAVLNRCDALYAGETLGRGAITPKRLVYLWMHSTEHRHILLSRSPRRIGIGAYPNQRGEWVVAADFVRL